jgi:hypothetical protein
MTLLEAKKQEIYRVLAACGGNKSKAAEKLDMSLRSLRDLTNSDPMFREFKNENAYQSINFKEAKPTMTIQIQPHAQEQKVSEVFDTKEVVTTLNGLMKKVTEKDCTAETVNAACNCASQITQLLRVHLDVERLKTRFS